MMEKNGIIEVLLLSVGVVLIAIIGLILVSAEPAAGEQTEDAT